MLRINCCVFYMSYIITTQYLKKNKKKFLGTNKWFHPCLPQIESHHTDWISFPSRWVELLPFKALSKVPFLGGYIIWCNSKSIAGSDLKWQGLILQICIYVPILTPVPSHWKPTSSGSFDLHCHYISRSSNISYQDRDEQTRTIHRKADSSLSSAF